MFVEVGAPPSRLWMRQSPTRTIADFPAGSGGVADGLGGLDRLVALQIDVDGLARHRTPEKIALREVAPLIRQPVQIGVGFDALRRRLQTEAGAELNDG